MNEASVGFFVDSFTPIVDGVTTTVRNCAWWLGRILGPTCVVTPRVPDHEDQEAFPVVRFLSMPTVVRQPYRLGLAELDPRLRAVLRRREFSLIHAHSPFSAGRAALKTAREKGVPIVATFHSKFRDDLCRVVPIRCVVRDQVKRIVDFLYSVDRVWIPQPSVAATLREYGYLGPYEVVENGTDFTPPPSAAPYRAEGARCLGIPDGQPVGLYVGQMILEKNLELLLRSLPHVVSRVPGFRMVMVGQGYARRRLMRLAHELGLQDRVLFHDVILDRELLKAVYARADLFLLPSLYDNAPLVIREAAALGAPSLLICGSTAAEVIRDNANGFLAEADEEAFGARIAQVILDEGLRARAGDGARRTLCRSWQSVTMEMREKYLALISGGGRRTA